MASNAISVAAVIAALRHALTPRAGLVGAVARKYSAAGLLAAMARPGKNPRTDWSAARRGLCHAIHARPIADAGPTA